MKLRKVMAWTLASAMFAGLLAGCGGSTQTTETAAVESGSEEGGSSAEGGKVLRYQASTLVDSLIRHFPTTTHPVVLSPSL